MRGGFCNDRQRKAMFANMFSKGRAPKIGEIVYAPGDPSVGIFGADGKVVAVYKDSADVEFKTSRGSHVEELGFEEFEDQESLRAKKEFEDKLFREWEEESDKRFSFPSPAVLSTAPKYVYSGGYSNDFSNDGSTQVKLDGKPMTRSEYEIALDRLRLATDDVDGDRQGDIRQRVYDEVKKIRAEKEPFKDVQTYFGDSYKGGGTR